VHDAGWARFVATLEYEAARYGRTLIRADRFEPASQTCSACGVLDGPNPLHVRSWTCTACGTRHDRDVNAARDILAAGRAERRNACGGTASPAAQRGGRDPVKQEANKSAAPAAQAAPPAPGPGSAPTALRHAHPPISGRPVGRQEWILSGGAW